MLKEILITVRFTVPIHISDFPDIPDLSIIYIPFEFFEIPTPTYDNLHMPLLIQENNITELICSLDGQKRVETFYSSINMMKLHIPHPHIV